MNDDKFKDIVEVFEFTRADAASVGLKNGTHRLLDVKQGVNDEGSQCALYIIGKINPETLNDDWDGEEPASPVFD